MKFKHIVFCFVLSVFSFIGAYSYPLLAFFGVFFAVLGIILIVLLFDKQTSKNKNK